jgi:phenylacetate 2-hydroxylase
MGQEVWSGLPSQVRSSHHLVPFHLLSFLCLRPANVCYRMGTKRVVIANTYQAVKDLWIDNQSSLISRPTLYTFHTVVSSSQGFTIGTSPWDESCKQRRKAAATALNRPAVASYMPIVDLESKCSIRDIYLDSNKGTKEINPKPYFQRFALNTVISILLNHTY